MKVFALSCIFIRPFEKRSYYVIPLGVRPSVCWGWSGGAMVLGKLPVPGRPTILITVGQGPAYGACRRCGCGVVWTFLLSSILSPLSPSLLETARYSLKYCLKGLLNPKATNQPSVCKLIRLRVTPPTVYVRLS